MSMDFTYTDLVEGAIVAAETGDTPATPDATHAEAGCCRCTPRVAGSWLPTYFLGKLNRPGVTWTPGD